MKQNQQRMELTRAIEAKVHRLGMDALVKLAEDLNVVVPEASGVQAARGKPVEGTRTGGPTETVPLGKGIGRALPGASVRRTWAPGGPGRLGAPAGVATLGIAVDDYTTVKLRGALGAFGQDGVVAAADLGDAPALAERLWAARHELRGRGREIAGERRRE